VLTKPRHELYFTSVSDSEHTYCQLDEEFGHIENGALKNKMIINKAKTEEWYFIGLTLLNLTCLIHLTALLRSVLLSFLV